MIATIYADKNGGYTAVLGTTPELHRTKRYGSLAGAQHAMQVWLHEQNERPVPVIRRVTLQFEVVQR